MKSIYEFSVLDQQDQAVALDRYQGQVLLIVNTASQCGFTPQYAGLQKLYESFAARGFNILAFPCNQFGGQEPSDNAQIAQFCEQHYHIRFSVFAKIDVNGERADPLFDFLKSQIPGILGSEAIKWNFTKFLVGKDGRVYQRYAPQTAPENIIPDIENLLSE